MKVLNNKILMTILDDGHQPQKTIFSPNADMLKLFKIVDVGEKVELVKKGDIVTTYVNNVTLLNGDEYFCTERDILFINDYPQPGKIHLRGQVKEKLTLFNSAEVIKSSSGDIEDEDKVFYKAGQSHVLPDSTEIISESQVYYSNNKG